MFFGKSIFFSNKCFIYFKEIVMEIEINFFYFVIILKFNCKEVIL